MKTCPFSLQTLLSTYSNMLEVGIGDLTTCTQLVDFCTVWLAAGKEAFTLSTEYIQQYVRSRHLLLFDLILYVPSTIFQF